MHTRFNCHVPENEGAQQNESACAKKHVSSSLRVDGSDKSLKHGCLCPMRRNVATVQSRETQTTCTCSNNAWLDTAPTAHAPSQLLLRGGWCCFEPREQGMWGSFDCPMQQRHHSVGGGQCGAHDGPMCLLPRLPPHQTAVAAAPMSRDLSSFRLCDTDSFWRTRN
jgi:hypothetical protein